MPDVTDKFQNKKKTSVFCVWDKVNTLFNKLLKIAIACFCCQNEKKRLVKPKKKKSRMPMEQS